MTTAILTTVPATTAIPTTTSPEFMPSVTTPTLTPSVTTISLQANKTKETTETNKTKDIQIDTTQNDMNMYDFYLTPKEQQLITYLNKQKKTIIDAEKIDRLENLSIKSIYKRWSDRIYKIINDSSEEVKKVMEFQPSGKLEERKGWWEKYRLFLSNMIMILTKEDRLLMLE